ncbi:hypothetical protein [Microbacterium sp. Marseille-Q6965]|uniref:hypothetical protein n=1 Tax=Microbacterium sp. Marseille-Q6965 TaxID=2965072 RepID=UPI0021B7AEDF|nr:hypothetical protein [Microbacterium sp. Marseille-Q6965]
MSDIEPEGAPAPADTQGAAHRLTGNDGQLGTDALTGDAALTGGDEIGGATLPGGADTPSEVYGNEDLDEAPGPDAPDEEEGQI